MNPEQRTNRSGLKPPVAVQLQTAGRIYACDAGLLTLATGDQVVVETEQGNALGNVIALAPSTALISKAGGIRRILKKADVAEREREERNRTRERDAVRVCLQRVRERGLRMKLIKAELAFDASKTTIYFSADGRIDFRDLVRELAHVLHTRIEMKQIGARDEAKTVGAVGPCGRELCCSSWLRDIGGVSVKMAKAQGLSPNPSKLAGMCGRLKCCLRYEYDTYLELGRALPQIGSAVVSVKGDGIVTRQNLLKQLVTIRREDGTETEASLEDLVEKKPQ